MNKLVLLALFSVSLSALAIVPNGAIPFIEDGQLFITATINDSIKANCIYDTGASCLYLDKHFVSSCLPSSVLRQAKTNIQGAGNRDNEQCDIYMEPLSFSFGARKHKDQYVPILGLKEILGAHIDAIIGNTFMLKSPLIVNFDEHYFLPKKKLSRDDLEGYAKLEARFRDNRIDVMAELSIDSINRVKGWFRLDFGCEPALVLTKETVSELDLSNSPTVFYKTQAGGIGGWSKGATIRANHFCITDTIDNVVVNYSLNENGALSSNFRYKGLIGTRILRNYNIILDPKKGEVWVKRNGNIEMYSDASITHMSHIDRTDICDGWVVNGLYEGGVAERAGIEIGDVILSINGRPVNGISWEEQRRGLDLKGETIYKVRKQNGNIVIYTLLIGKQII